jgi:2-dehydro-3-deoxyglucarate aldolase/4-hydroxy-2-oxoheptanedioate aldolase
MSLRTLLRADTVPVGHLIFEFATPGIGYLVRNGGADFLIFDLEHSGFGFETAKLAVLSARAADLPIIVRVPSHDPKDLARACDIGADGIMAPLVDTAAEAAAIVAAVKYPPEGRRGVGQLQMHDRYRAGAFADKARAANEAMAVFVQIESGSGAENVDAIAAVPGVDCLWIGHMDLSCSLGTPGRFDTDEFAAAVAKTIAACRRHGKRAGRLAPNVADATALAAAGFDCLALGTDTNLYQTALAQGIAQLRQQLREHRR